MAHSDPRATHIMRQIASDEIAANTTCPQDPATCKCPEHYQGLRAHAGDPDAYDRALSHCRPTVTRLSIVTLGPTTEPEPCTNTMLCPCLNCRAATAYLTRRGAQGEGNASPFKVRKAA
jgi:hypothetical protein